MMVDTPKRAEEYRALAAEARHKAAGRSPEFQDSYLQIAKNYEVLAETVGLSLTRIPRFKTTTDSKLHGHPSAASETRFSSTTDDMDVVELSKKRGWFDRRIASGAKARIVVVWTVPVVTFSSDETT